MFGSIFVDAEVNMVIQPTAYSAWLIADVEPVEKVLFD
jgi:hypothetical protein